MHTILETNRQSMIVYLKYISIKANIFRVHAESPVHKGLKVMNDHVKLRIFSSMFIKHHKNYSFSDIFVKKSFEVKVSFAIYHNHRHAESITFS